MYVSPIQTCLFWGRSTPEIRAMSYLPLTLFVFRVLANDPHDALAADDFAFRADPLHRRTYFHDRLPFSRLLETVDDPAPSEVVRRQLHQDPVARQDADEMLPHLAGDVCQDLMLVVQLHAEHRVGERLDHHGLDLDRLFFFGQTLFSPVSAQTRYQLKPKTRAPDEVTATENSKWADREPSTVRAVQPSASIRTPALPALTIGSIASTSPGRSFGPLPGLP